LAEELSPEEEDLHASSLWESGLAVETAAASPEARSSSLPVDPNPVVRLVGEIVWLGSVIAAADDELSDKQLDSRVLLSDDMACRL